MEGSVDAQLDKMPSLFHPFRNAHGGAHGLCTPPTSPDRSEHLTTRDAPCLPFQKLLRRSTTAPPTPNPRSDGMEKRAYRLHKPSARDSKISTSPFRVVKEMKAPFPLLLPGSPASMDDRYGRSSTPPQLRKVADSYRNLRALAEAQPSWQVSKLPACLLPSPIFLEKFDEVNRHTDSPTSEAWTDCTEPYVPYEDHRILSDYYRPEPYTDEPGPAVETDLPYTPGKADRTRTNSEESDWLAGSNSHEQRRRRFRQRCFQVVQHPISGKGDIMISDDGESQIMLAHLLVGPGKPKLVQISRPSSMSLSTNSTMSAGVPPARPVTPVQEPRKEQSAFSPYDTPSDQRTSIVSPARIRIVERHSVQSVITDSSLCPAPLRVSFCRNLHKSDSAVFVDSIPCGVDDDQADSCLSDSDATGSLTKRDRATTEITRPSSVRALISPRLGNAAWSRCRRLERAMDAVTNAVESFPSGILRLNSPIILELRHASVPESVHIKYLQRILPSTSPLLLSALAAWLIVDIYFNSLRLTSDSSAPSPGSVESMQEFASRSNESLHRIPTKARATLGIALPDQTYVQTHEKMLRRRAQFVHISVGVVSQRLMEALRGRWDEALWRACKVVVEMIEDR